MPIDHESAYSILEYSYRDASGYAVYDCILLNGSFCQADRDLIISKLEGRELFIPEKVGIPPLQHRLYQYSAGQPTEDDHPWHEMIDLRAATPDEVASIAVLADAQELVAKFAAVADWESWRYNLYRPAFSKN